MSTIGGPAEPPKGWRVIRGTQTDKQRSLGSYKWEKISRVFTVKSAAYEFMRLVESQYPDDYIQVESVYCK